MSIRHLGPLALSGAIALATWPAQAQEAPPASGSAPAAAATTQPKDADVRPGSDWHMIGAIAAYSLAAVAGGTFAYTLVRTHQLQNDRGYQQYRQGFSSGNVCDHAASGDIGINGMSPGHASSICSASDTLHTLSIVSVVTAVVGIGTGTALLLTRPSTKDTAAAQTPRLAFSPVIGVHGAAAQFDYRF